MSHLGSVDLTWRHGTPEVVLDIPIFKVEMTPTINNRTGAGADFYRLLCRDWVNVLALTEEKELVMIRQHRHGTRTLEIEVPAGVIEYGEDPIAAAERELREETGFVPLEPGWLLETVYPNPAIQNNRCHFVVFDRVRFCGASEPEALESIEIFTEPLEQVKSAIAEGKINHALMAYSILLYLFKKSLTP